MRSSSGDRLANLDSNPNPNPNPSPSPNPNLTQVGNLAIAVREVGHGWD